MKKIVSLLLVFVLAAPAMAQDKSLSRYREKLSRELSGLQSFHLIEQTYEEDFRARFVRASYYQNVSSKQFALGITSAWLGTFLFFSSKATFRLSLVLNTPFRIVLGGLYGGVIISPSIGFVFHDREFSEESENWSEDKKIMVLSNSDLRLPHRKSYQNLNLMGEKGLSLRSDGFYQVRYELSFAQDLSMDIFGLGETPEAAIEMARFVFTQMRNDIARNLNNELQQIEEFSDSDIFGKDRLKSLHLRFAAASLTRAVYEGEVEMIKNILNHSDVFKELSNAYVIAPVEQLQKAIRFLNLGADMAIQGHIELSQDGFGADSYWRLVQSAMAMGRVEKYLDHDGKGRVGLKYRLVK